VIPIKDINPTDRIPFVTILLVIANVIVFLYQMGLGTRQDAFVSAFALVPVRLFHPSAAAAGTVPAGVTIFTAMFLHGGFLHVAGNMLYLWIFGNNVEEAMGRVRFLVFYLLTGFVAAYGHALTNTRSAVPMIGASGAVSGILGAYLLLYPRARVITLVFIGFLIRTIEVPAMIVLGFWFVLQFLNALVSAGGTGGGVAWFAHVGGFVAGMALVGLFKHRGVPFGGGRSYRYL
jgi:membrane associated rhomboid family serine protease